MKLQTGVELTNKKIRHRLKKAVFILDTALTGERPVKPHVAAKPSAVPPDLAPLSAEALATLVHSLSAAKSEGDILSALTAVPARPEDLLCYFRGDLAAVQAARRSLEDTCAVLQGKLGSKAKRKLLRITSAMASLSPVEACEKKRRLSDGGEVQGEGNEPPPLSEQSSRKKAKSTPTVDLAVAAAEEEANKKANEFLAEVVSALRACTSSGEVEAALGGVGGENGVMGNFTNRRALKRVLTQLLSPPADHSSDRGVALTSNARRKVKRVLEGLQVASTLRSEKYGWKSHSERADEQHGTTTDMSCTNMESGDAGIPKGARQVETKATSDPKPLKIRLFLGQLAFTTTESDIRNHIAQHGIKCEVQIRMLTNKDSGESRGSAFVDVVGGKRAVRKFMSLHHTVLNGRRINVERTVRVPKTTEAADARALEIKQDRLKQKIAHSELVDKLLMKYHDTGITDKINGVTGNDSLMNRLYAMNVKEAKDVLDEYRAQVGPTSKHWNEGVFRSILNRHDSGGSAVDQARETANCVRGFGMSGLHKKRKNED